MAYGEWFKGRKHNRVDGWIGASSGPAVFVGSLMRQDGSLPYGSRAITASGAGSPTGRSDHRQRPEGGG